MYNYQARFAKQGTIAEGTDAYYEYTTGRGGPIHKAKVVRVTKTLVELETQAGNYVFRYQPSYDRYVNKDRYSEMTLVTEETYTTNVAYLAKEKATNDARGRALMATQAISEKRRWMGSSDLEEAIAILQEQAAALKALGL